MSTSLMLAAAISIGAPALKDKEPLGTGPGYMGITFQADGDGFMITDVKANSPAAKAGVKANDVIVKIEGAVVANSDTGEFVKLIGGMRPGTVVTLDVRRGAENLVLKVKLGPRPADFTPTPPLPPPIIDP